MSCLSPPVSPFPETDDPDTMPDVIMACNRVTIGVLPQNEFEELVRKTREQLPPGTSTSLLTDEVRKRVAEERKRHHDGANKALEGLVASTSRQAVETKRRIYALRKELWDTASFDIFCKHSGEKFWLAASTAHMRKGRAKKKASSRPRRRSARLKAKEEATPRLFKQKTLGSKNR